jgi:hypothetical protein
LIRSGGKKSSVVAPQPSQTHSRTNLEEIYDISHPKKVHNVKYLHEFKKMLKHFSYIFLNQERLVNLHIMFSIMKNYIFIKHSRNKLLNISESRAMYRIPICADCQKFYGFVSRASNNSKNFMELSTVEHCH